MTIYGPDISSFQAGISLHGAIYCLCKVTESTNYYNADYSRAKVNAAGSGCYFCAYHFLHAGNAAAQASWAYSHAGKTPLMIDIEPTSALTRAVRSHVDLSAGLASNPSVADVAVFTDAYRKLGGTVHLGYLPHWYWQQLGSPDLTMLGAKKICLVSSAYSAYTDASSGVGWQAYGGLTPIQWQYTDSLGFNGQNVDFNAFRGHYAGNQTVAGVAACLAEYKSITTTGAFPVPVTPPPLTKPTRLTAAGNESLLHAVTRQHTTLDRALWLMAHDTALPHGYGARQQTYIDRADFNALMPPGMPYWIG